MDVHKFSNVQPPTRCRLSVVEYVYHQQPGQQPRAVEHRFCRDLQSDEQTYTRVFQATEEWSPLDTGFLGSNVGHLSLVNEEGRQSSASLSPEEKLDLAKRVVEVGLFINYLGGHHIHSFCVVRPGESIRLTPTNIGEYRACCLAGKARCTLTLIPA
jgi:hypothetical protein